MTSPIPPIGPLSPPTVPLPMPTPSSPPSDGVMPGSGLGAVGGGSSATGTATSGADFASALAKGFDEVQAAQQSANQLAVQAATGQLVDPAQLTIATTKAQMLTQMATTIQSKAVTAFNTIMSMQA